MSRLFDNYSHSSSTLSPKIMGHILKNKEQFKCVYIHKTIQITIMKTTMKKKNRLDRYGKNSPRTQI